MASSTVEQTVRRLVCQVLDVEDSELKPTAHLVDDLGADSLDLVLIAVGLEEEFFEDYDIPNAERFRWRNIGDILRTVTEVLEYQLTAKHGG